MRRSRTRHGCSPVRGKRSRKRKSKERALVEGWEKEKKALEQNLARNSSRESAEGHLIFETK